MKKEPINYSQQQQQNQPSDRISQQQPPRGGLNSDPNLDSGNNGGLGVGAGSTTLDSPSTPTVTGGGRFDFDDGGVYVGGWQEGKAHGHGICTGPKGQGEYSGSFNFGFEVCGVYKWPSGAVFEGQWLNGKRHGLGVEFRGKWVYKGEWTQGYKGRYGVRSSLLSAAKYEGTWANGLQDGYGSETYADTGTYQGQWLRGMRHGYGVRQSAAYGHSNVIKSTLNKNVSMQSLDTEGESTLIDIQGKRDSALRGGFVLVVTSSASAPRSGSAPSGTRRRLNSLEKSPKTGFFKGILRKQKSTGDIEVRSNRSSSSVASASEPSTPGMDRKNDPDADAISQVSFLSQDVDISDPATTENYIGEWKNDKRCGFGICERSDGIRYEGEWYNNKKCGYGVTFFRDGSREEGKYKNNCLVTNARKKHLFLLRSGKLRERIESAVVAARQAQQIALQKADIAISRTATARGKAEQSDAVAAQSRVESGIAYKISKQYGGAGVTNLQQTEAPLRRRLSDFSHIRRGTQANIAQVGVGGGGGLGVSGPFIDPNEPFGGRRGSFRTGSGLAPRGNGLPNNNNNNNNYNNPPTQHSSSLQFTTGTNQAHLASSSLHTSVQDYQQHSLQSPPQPPLSQTQTPHLHLHPHQHQQLQLQLQQQHQQQQQLLQQQQLQQQLQLQQKLQQIQMQQQQLPQSSEPDPLNDHLDHYQKLVKRYSNRKGKHLILPEIRPDRFRSPETIPSKRNENQVTASLDKAYGASSTIPDPNQSQPPQQLPQAIDMSNDSSITRTPKRTASLYRPSAMTGGGGESSSTSGKSVGLRRKPSLQVPSSKSKPEPVMSREEVSVLSHATRLHRRQEAELAERLARNPLLYLVNPRFKDWLSRQQIIITVLFINTILAVIFFQLLG